MATLIDIPAQHDHLATEWKYLKKLAYSLVEKKESVVLLLSEEQIDNWTSQYPKSVKLVAWNKGNRLQRWMNLRFRLQQHLSKQAADTYISTIPKQLHHQQVRQVLLLDQLAYLTSERYRKQVSKCRYILVHGKYWQQLIIQKQPEATVELVYAGGGNHEINIIPADVDTFKNTYSNGADYFLFCSNETDNQAITTLLKAYTIFKKFQRSGIKILLSVPEKARIDFEPLLQQYKFKSDVVFLHKLNETEIHTAIAGAYATMHSNLHPVITTPMLIATQNGVPMILPENEVLQSEWADIALFTPNTAQGWATQLMLLYKDETMRSTLSELSKAKAVEMLQQRI